MTKPYRFIILISLALLVFSGGMAYSGTQNPVSAPVSAMITPGTQTGGNANGRPVSVILTPGPQTGGNANGRPVSVILTPGPQTGGNANGRPVSVILTPGPQTGGNAKGRPVSVILTPGPQTGGAANSKPASVYVQQLKDVVPGLVGYWPMDGDWKDASGNGNDGVPYNGATCNNVDAKGGAYSANFDGVDDRTDVTVPAGQLNIGNQSWAMSAWFKSSYSGTSAKNIAYRYEYGWDTTPPDGDAAAGYWLQISYDGYAQFLVRSSFTTGLFTVTDSITSIRTNIRDGNWHYISGVLDRTSSPPKLYIYVDGVQKNSVIATGLTAINDSGSPLRIGNTFEGLIDELAIFNRALSADEVRAHYLNGIIPGLHAPAIDPMTTPTASPGILFTGTKDIGTSIWINGAEAVPADSSVTWQAAYTLMEGLNILKFSEHDASQNVSPEVVVNVVLDTVPPAAGSLTINNGAVYTNLASVSLKLSPTDSGSGVSSMQFSNDGAAWSEWETNAANKTWALPAGDGIKTVYARFKDAVGNASSSVSAAITLDTVAPATPAIEAYTDLTNQNAQTISGDRGADASTVVITLNGAALGAGAITYPTPATWSAQLTGLVDGENTVSLKARDAAGNESAPSAAIKIVVDKKAPAWSSVPGVRFVEPGDGHATVRWNAAADKEGAGAGYNIYKSETTPVDFSKAAKISIPSEHNPLDYTGRGYDYEYRLSGLTNNKLYYITVRTADKFGNEDSNIITLKVLPQATAGARVDFTTEDWSGDLSGLVINPDGSVSLATGEVTGTYTSPSFDLEQGNSVSATSFNSICDTAYGQKVEVAVDDGTGWTSVSDGQQDGLPTGRGITYRVTLTGDGTSSPVVKSASFAYNDFSPPAAPTVNVSTSPTDQSSITVSGTKDAGTSIWINGQEMLPLNESTDWQAGVNLAVEGGNNFSVFSKDKAGNQSQAAVFTIIRDTMPPVIASSDPTGGSLSPGISSISVSLTDTGSSPDLAGSAVNAAVKQGADTVAGSWAVLNGSLVFTPATTFSDGGYTVTLYPADVLGNKATTPTTVSFTLDATPPAVQLSMGPASPHKAEAVTFTLTFSENMNTAVKPLVNFGQDAPYDSFALPAGSWLDAKKYSAVYTFGQSVQDGSYTVKVSGAKDAAGNFMLETQAGSFVLDETPPATPTVNAVTTPTKVANLDLSGAKEPGSAIVINGKAVVPIDNSGTWVYKYLLIEGTNTLNIISRDVAGNDSAPVTPAPVVVLDTTPPDFTINYTTPTTKTTQTLTGQKEPGSVLKVNGAVIPDANDVSPAWLYDITLTDGIVNNFTFTASDSLGNTKTKTISILCDTNPPAALGPGILTAAGGGNGSTVTLSWTGYNESLVPDLAYYKVYVSSAPIADVSGMTSAGTANKGQRTFTATNLTTGVTYYFAVVPVDQSGNFRTAVNNSSAVPTDTQAPEEVTNLKASCAYDKAAGTNSVTITWSASANTKGDLTSQKVYLDGGSGYDPGTALAKDVLSYVKAGIADNRHVKLKVTVIDQAGNESIGRIVEATTRIDNPTGLIAVPGNGSVSLAWNKPVSTYLKQYNVYQLKSDQQQSDASAMTFVKSTTATSASLTGLANGEMYQFAVTSVNTSDAENTNISSIPAKPRSDSAGPVIGAFEVKVGSTVVLDGAPVTQPAVVNVTAADSESQMAKVELYIDGTLVKSQTGGSLSYSWDVVLTTDGNHILKAMAYDAPGNQSELLRTCIVSLGAPPAPVISGHTILGFTATISGTAAADTTVVLISGGIVVGSATTQNGQFQFTGVALKEGVNDFYAKASHRGGDSQFSVRYSILVDTGAPEAPAGLAAKAAPGGILKFTWSAGPGEAPTGYNIYYSSSSFSLKTQAGVMKTNSSLIKFALTDYTPPDDGIRYYAVTALDTAGNESGISNVVSVSSDRVAPFLTSRTYRYMDTKGGVTEQAQVAGPGRVEVSIAVNEPLSEMPFFSITPASAMPIVVALAKSDDTHWKGEFPVTSLTSHGKTQYQFTGKDIVGNRGTAGGEGIFIDLQGPVAAITEPVSLLKLTDQPVSIKAQFDEPQVGLPSLELVDTAGAPVKVDNVTDTGDGLHFTGAVNISGLAEGEAKFNLVSAIDKFGNKSDIVTSGKSIILYKDQPPAPPVPTGLITKTEKGGKVTLTWTPVGGAVAYRLYRRAGGDDEPKEVGVGLTATTAPDIPDTDGKYYYSVSSVGQLSSESARCAEVEAVSDRTPPDAPSGLTLAFGANGVTAAWSAPQGEAPASYNLFRAASSITSESAKSLVPILKGAKALSASDPSPVSSLRYYAITAVDTLGNEGPPSESKDITFPVAPVRNLILIRMDGAAPVVTWEEPQTGVSYNIYRDSLKVNSSPVSQTSYTDGSYNGGGVKYGISVVDTYGNESPIKEVLYSGFDAGLAAGVTINSGYVQKLPILLDNPGDTDISVESINLQVGGGAQSILAGPFVVGAKSSLQVEKIGATSLDTPSPAAVSVTAQWSPSPGVIVIVSTTRSAEVAGAGATMDLFSEPLIRGAEARVWLKVYNRGDADMELVTSENDGPSSQVKVYLKDQDGNLLAQGSLNQRADAAGKIINGSGYAVARIAPGGSFLTDEIKFTVPVTAPYSVNLEAVVANTYYRYRKPEQVTAAGIRQVVPSTISEAAYRAAAGVAQTFYSGAQPVAITGQAISNTTGAPVPQVPVVIGVSLRGFDRYYTVNTDAQGSFSYNFQPGVNEAGIYSVWANHPDVKNRSVQATFTIAGMEMSPATATVKVLKGGYWDIPLTLKNPGDTPLTGITYSITATSGASAAVINNNSTTIDPGKTVYRTLRVSLSQGSPDVSQVALNVTTDQGPQARLDATVIGVTSIPVISASPSVIDTGIVRGDQRIITINLTNSGAGTLRNARVERPATSWITLATDPAIGDLAPGGKATVAVLLKPDASVAQKVYDDAVVIASDNHIPFRIPVQCTVVSDSVGSVSFDVMNSLNQKVIGATVRIQNASLYELSYTKNTDTSGAALFADIPAGSYVYTASAPNCKPYSGSFEVVPGVVGLVPVALEVNLIEVEFTVTPVVIEDRYEIQITQTFQTDVPVPVLIVDPPVVNLPALALGQVFNGEFTVTNYGLIAGENFHFTLPATFGDYSIECLGNVPSTIGAKQTITIPYRVIRK